jgi:hypothetical protein
MIKSSYSVIPPYKFKEIKKFDYGVACKGIKLLPNFTKIRLAIIDLLLMA